MYITLLIFRNFEHFYYVSTKVFDTRSFNLIEKVMSEIRLYLQSRETVSLFRSILNIHIHDVRLRVKYFILNSELNEGIVKKNY